MRAVLISIKPQWCELIANGKKTIEVRKTKPKHETPFKCYIYCTQGKKSKALVVGGDDAKLIICTDYNKAIPVGGYIGNEKVIGEFVCDKMTDCRDIHGQAFSLLSCMSLKEWIKYTEGHKGAVWAWHISNLVIYDKPKELSEFYRKCENMPCEGCEHLKYQGVNSAEYDYDCEFLGNKLPINRPPQSWCYVESVGDGNA